MEAVRQRGLASGCLIGTYARPDGSIDDSQTEKATVMATSINLPQP